MLNILVDFLEGLIILPLPKVLTDREMHVSPTYLCFQCEVWDALCTFTQISVLKPQF